MSIEAYQAFSAAASEKSFLRASEILNLSPSAVSHSIAGLEAELGIRLFDRVKGGVVLTSAGEALQPYIENIVKGELSLKQQARALTSGEGGRVSIGLFNSVCISWIPRILQSFREEHPGIDVVINEGSYEDILGWIAHKSVDIAFISRTVYDKSDFEPLHLDPMICVAPENFNPRNGVSMTPDDIREARLISQRGLNNTEVERYLFRNDIPLQTAYVISSDQSFISLVESGLGICLLQKLNMTGSTARVRILPLDPPMDREIGIVLPDSRSATPAVLLLKEHIRETIKAIEGKV